jgi:hypothetical protein
MNFKLLNIYPVKKSKSLVLIISSEREWTSYGAGIIENAL